MCVCLKHFSKMVSTELLSWLLQMPGMAKEVPLQTWKAFSADHFVVPVHQ